jgi:hypothetical protein
MGWNPAQRAFRRTRMMIAFLACQLYVVLFVALHDWLPLGSLNNLARIRAVDTACPVQRRGRLLVIISSQ